MSLVTNLNIKPTFTPSKDRLFEFDFCTFKHVRGFLSTFHYISISLFPMDKNKHLEIIQGVTTRLPRQT